MAKKATETPVEDSKTTSAQDLVQALVQAIQLTKPAEKKNAINRKPGDPWQPKDGSKKLKLKRKIYQHGIPIDPDLCDNETIDALNRLRPGRYMEGFVKVYKRKDQGIEIEYPIKTASQKIKLVSTYGVRSLKDFCDRCIAEHNDPAKFTKLEDEDLG
jgi:hypothetical protein